MIDNIKEENGVLLQGHIKITDAKTGEVIVDKRNAIHYENMSISLAESLANAGQGTIYQMAFGNGGTSIDLLELLHIVYPTVQALTLVFITQTFIKVVDDRSVNNTDPARNKIESQTRKWY